MNILEKLRREKVMAMIRGIHPVAAELTVEALALGGIRFIEVTTNTQDAYALVERWRKIYDRDLLIGVGTVLDVGMAKQAVNSGAQFIVSPNLDEEVIAYGARNNIDVYPGVMTPTEIVRAIKAGAKAVKVFPTGSLGGAAFIKEIRAPLNHVPIIASGSVGLHNIREILNSGAFAVGIGGNLVNRHWIESGNFVAMQKLARELVDVVADSLEVH